MAPVRAATEKFMSDQSPLLCQADQSVLLVVDIQTRLARAMPEGSLDQLNRNLARLLRAADLLSVPVLVTEQYPQGIGPTLDEIREQLPQAAQIVEKTTFSACEATEFMEVLAVTDRRQVVVAGMEAHVCVLQTAIELHRAGYEVFVVQDCICSRVHANAEFAVQRMRDAGIRGTVCESVLFEWMRDSRHPHFKTISALIR